MHVDLFHYDLPAELIAQHPIPDPEDARLLQLTPGCAPSLHRVGELSELLEPGSVVVMNDTRVIPARLLGQKSATGGKVEIFLVRKTGESTLEAEHAGVRPCELWRALGKSSKPLRFGGELLVADRSGKARLVVRLLSRAEDDGLLEVALWTLHGEPVTDMIFAVGHVPLPPYIKRADDASDFERYQTVVAREDGAIAAPTAGLHITRKLLGRFAVRGIELCTVTLHVGLGTFQPVTVQDFDEHPMHAEMYSVSQRTADLISAARQRGSPVVAIGTTTVRALESARDDSRPGHVLSTSGETKLLIQPGYQFAVVDRLVTNFHLPKSTLLAMVCAFGGQEEVLSAYRTAIDERFRFYSYGDAMLLDRAHAAGGAS